MTEGEKSMAEAKARLLAAALPHVAFDGWSQATFDAAVADSGLPAGLAMGLCPRGALDLAVAYHRAGDASMAQALAERNDLATLKIREKVAIALRLRLQNADREAVRRAAALYALPAHTPEGAALIWGTADAIWTALGDSSTDVNWYTKRGTLAAAYGATVLFWLGDDSEAQADTWEFLSRRIENIMQIEKAKGAFRENPIGRALLNGPLKILERFHAPKRAQDLPGQVLKPSQTQAEI
jgi:ubiquinone biosynthesis protein COQ9